MYLATTLSYYKQTIIQEALYKAAEHKEIAIRYKEYFGKRPEAILADGDILEFAQNKATSFHSSEELWRNPLHIRTGMGRKELEEERIGWDFILDIDCPYWPLSKLITHLFIQALKEHGVRSVTAKFSGNKGFHIAVPFEAFPETINNEKTKNLFPEAPRRMAYYLLDYIVQNYVEETEEEFIFESKYKVSKQTLAKEFNKPIESFSKTIDLATGQEVTRRQEDKKIPILCRACGYASTTNKEGLVHTCPVCKSIMTEEQTNETTQRVITKVFDPLSVIEVDTILIAHRHMYRMPYSLHEKTWLASVPVDITNILGLAKHKEWAKPGIVNTKIAFLERTNAQQGEASKLILKAYDYQPRIEQETQEQDKEYEIPQEAIPEDYFPPCIHNILKGVKDGRKRSLFTLINFLRGVGWAHEHIEERVREWNKHNDEAMREVEIKGRLRYEKTKKEAMPPHNCRRYYEDFRVCQPDELCQTIKNPLQYAKKKAAMAGVGAGKKGVRAKLTEEQKAARKEHRQKQQTRSTQTDA